MYEIFIEETRKVPMARLFLPFLVGLVLHEMVSFAMPISGLLLAVVSSVLLYVWLTKRISYKYTHRWVFGLVVHVFLILSGFLYMDVYENKPYLKNIDEKTRLIVAQVDEWPEERERTWKLLLSVKAGITVDSVFPSSGRVLAYLSKDSLASTIKLGDRLILSNKFAEITNNKNPYEFDYKKYLRNQGIRRQAFLRAGDWQKIDSLKGNPVKLFAGNLRQKLLNLFKEKGLQGDEFAVASALTLGYRAALDEDIRRSYSSSGAMHVLAVSGLHVGIIYFVLNYLLKFLTKRKAGIVLRALLLLLGLWFYAFLTGLSPSVLRASTMFSFVIAGGALKRPANIYNTLAASAFFLVLMNPYILKAVGFQLSYMAVIGIVFFQPRIYKRIYIKNKLIDRMWALTCVSIGAQLGTFPLSLYYFQQFPNLFFITNLAVIPLATLILYSGIALFVFSFMSPVAAIFAFLLNWSVWILNTAVTTIESIPYSHTTGLYIFDLQLLLFYLLVLLITVFFIRRQTVFLKSALIILILHTGIWSYGRISAMYKRQLIVYNSGNMFALNYLGNGHNVMITNTADPENKRRLEFASRGLWTRYKAAAAEFHTLSDSVPWDAGGDFFGYRHFWNFRGTSFVVTDASFLTFQTPVEPLPADYLIITGRQYLLIDKLLNYVVPGKVILSSCVPHGHMQRYKQQLEEKELDFFSVGTQGAFVMEFRDD